MSKYKLPYIRLDDIKQVSDFHEVQELIQKGWVYLGFCSRTAAPNLGLTPEQDYQIPTHYLGDPSEDQDLSGT